MATAVLWLPLATVVAVVVLALLVLAAVRLLSLGLEVGHHPVHGRQAWQAWSILRVLDEARTWLFPLYSSGLTPAWLRALGADIGSDVEASTVLMIPPFVRVGDGRLPGRRHPRRRLRARRRLAARRARAGRQGRVRRQLGDGRARAAGAQEGPGRRALRGAAARAPPRPGPSWLGSPPRPLRRERDDGDAARTYAPPRRLRRGARPRRGLPASCRSGSTCCSSSCVVAALAALLDRGPWWAVLLGGPVLLAAGLLAGRRHRARASGCSSAGCAPSEHPLWSSFVWRNELADTFVEVVAAPWFARAATGTAVLNVWLRAMGSRIGRGVWCETYWLPEADLIDLRDGATVGRGCVVQTHLFHDRIL